MPIMPSAPDAPGPFPEKTIRLNVKVHLLALAAVLFLTALNGLFNSLNTEYGGKHATFLDRPADRHADLIKSALSLPPYGPDYIPGRDHAYRDFYVNNAYQSPQELRRGKLTALHVTPLMVVTMLGLKPLIILLGPSRVVEIYYLVAFLALALITWNFSGSFIEAVFIFLALAFSYPFLSILCRGNPGALLVAFCLIFFLYELFQGRHVVVPALFLALACNCRPNTVLLLPLLILLGRRNALRALAIFALATIALFLASYGLATHLDPDYNFTVARKAIQVYYKFYVHSDGGSQFNNSAFGAVWPFIHDLHFLPLMEDSALDAAQWIIGLAVVTLLSVFSLLYLRRQIDKYEYAFALGSLYILGSTIVATYHLFFFAFFILVAGLRSFHLNPTRCHYFILAAAIFMLVPKNYLFHHGISYEVILNPLMLTTTLAIIFFHRAPAPPHARFRDTLNWQPA
jgi:hypothetical protein